MADKTEVEVLGIPLYNQSIPYAIEQILRECKKSRENYCISATGAHGMVYAHRNEEFRKLLQSFYMNLPDGMPGVWVGRMKGAGMMDRCYGPDFFSGMMIATSDSDIRHFLCGGTDGVAEKLEAVCRMNFGNCNICGTFTPPFLKPDEYDYEKIAGEINRSKANIVWIGISTPKQEQFAARLAEVTDVHFLVTVGAAFDFHIGQIRQAPLWMQRSGLEWFYRLCMEPGRLWRRYLEIVPMFIYYSALDLIRHQRNKQT